MNQSEKNIALEFSMGWLVDLLLMAALLSLLNIPLGLARETQASFQDNDETRPVIQATETQEPEKTKPQEPEIPSALDTIDFLMGGSPAVSAPAPAALPDLRNPMLEKPDEVAMLVSEQCSQNGNAAEGTTSCERVYSNGHHAKVSTQSSNEGDELKRQTIIEEFDSGNALLFKKTIRHRVDYNYLNDQKAKEKEFFDIIYQPVGRKTTRELMVYEYFLDTGKAKSLSWTQYKQIANEPKAELAYHALLRYNESGSPERGLAEKWDHGKKTGTFMNWSYLSKGYVTLDEDTWGQWEGWIRNVSLQAYLP